MEGLINQDRQTFINNAHALQDASLAALAAINKRNPQALLDAGEAIDTACENCHLKYWYPLDRQAEKAKEGAASPRK
jgi:cytochrome c556